MFEVAEFIFGANFKPSPNRKETQEAGILKISKKSHSMCSIFGWHAGVKLAEFISGVTFESFPTRKNSPGAKVEITFDMLDF